MRGKKVPRTVGSKQMLLLGSELLFWSFRGTRDVNTNRSIKSCIICLRRNQTLGGEPFQVHYNLHFSLSEGTVIE